MPMRSAVFVLTVTMLAAACAQAPSKNPLPDTTPVSVDSVDDAAKTAMIEEIMVESGIDAAIAQMPEMAAMGFDQQPRPPVNRDDYETFRALLLKTFDAARIREIFVSHLSERYDPERFAEFLALLRTPLAQKMTALESEANTPQAQQEMMQTGNIIMGQTSPERLELARQFDEATGGTETALAMQMMMVEAIMTNMNKIVPPAQRMTDKQLEQTLEQLRMQSVFPARQYTQLSIIYMYRSVSNDELAQYTRLHQSETGQWGTALLREAWMKISEDISNDFAERMKNTFLRSNAL